MKHVQYQPCRAGLMLAAILASPLVLQATTYTYRTTGNSNWGASLNWSPGGIPSSVNDDAVFPSILSNGGYQQMNVSLNTPVSISALQIDTHGVFSLGGTGGLSLSGPLRDYVNQGGVPASHLINLANLDNLSGVYDIGNFANLTVASRINGSSIYKRGGGTLVLTNTSNLIPHVEVEAGTLSMTADAAPFTPINWSEPIFMHTGATFNFASSSTLSRPMRGVVDPGGEVHITAGSGVTGTIANGFWSFVPIDISGGGTVHSVSFEFTPLQTMQRFMYLNVGRDTTVIADHLVGNPALFLNGSTLQIGENTFTNKNIEILTNNSVNTVDTAGFTYSVAGLITGLPGVTFNKNGGGTLAVDNGNMSGFATVNVNGGKLDGALGGTATLHLANGSAFGIGRSQTAATAVHVTGSVQIDTHAGVNANLNGVGITGTGAIDFVGPGTTRLQTSSMGFAGTIVVSQGRLELQTQSSNTLRYMSIRTGATAALLAENQLDPYSSVEVGGALELNSYYGLGAAPATPTPSFILHSGAKLRVLQSLNTADTRNIYLDSGSQTLEVASDALIAIPGLVYGQGSLNKTGGGIALLQGRNTVSGPITVQGGTLVLDHPRDMVGATLPSGSIVNVIAGATVQLGWYAGQNNVAGTGENPAGITAFSLLGGTLTAARDTTHNLGAIHMTNGTITGDSHPLAGWGNYTLNSTVYFDDQSGEGTINAPGGINLRDAIAFDTTASLLNAPRALKLSASIHDEPGSAGTLIKRGAGRLNISGVNDYTGGTVVEAGRLSIAPAARLGGGTLTVLNGARVAFEPGGSTPQRFVSVSIDDGGVVDLADRRMIIGAVGGPAPLQSVRTMLRDGKLTSSPAAGDRAVGYADAGALSLATFGGQTMVEGEVALRLTLKGDANLDGAVDFNDLLTFAQNYGQIDRVWSNGDFDYDGRVNFSDLLPLAQNYGHALLASGNVVADASASFSVDWQRALALTPEPASALVGMAATCITSRKRRA